MLIIPEMTRCSSQRRTASCQFDSLFSFFEPRPNAPALGRSKLFRPGPAHSAAIGKFSIVERRATEFLQSMTALLQRGSVEGSRIPKFVGFHAALPPWYEWPGPQACHPRRSSRATATAGPRRSAGRGGFHAGEPGPDQNRGVIASGHQSSAVGGKRNRSNNAGISCKLAAHFTP